MVRALFSEGEADEAAAVAGHEIDGLGGDVFGGEGEVAFVFAVFVVDDDQHAAGANFVEGSGDVGKRGLGRALAGHAAEVIVAQDRGRGTGSKNKGQRGKGI